MTMLLEVSDLTKRFGGVTAVKEFSFGVKEGAIFGIIGPNGSGKTTSLNCINGIYKPDGGKVLLSGQEIQGLSPHELAAMGIGRTFQVPKIFKRITVIENLMASVLSSPLSNKQLESRAKLLLERVNLLDLANHMGEELSGGQQKLLELVRVLMFNPRLLLLDEPFAGVHPSLKTMFIQQILEMRNAGKTFILVSHDLTSVYTLCDEIAVLDRGRKIAQGNPRDIKGDERVIDAYLGR